MSDQQNSENSNSRISSSDDAYRRMLGCVLAGLYTGVSNSLYVGVILGGLFGAFVGFESTIDDLLLENEKLKAEKPDNSEGVDEVDGK